ncbi:MAG: hypothetical protein WKG06_35365 [Segetibacter sp.]
MLAHEMLLRAEAPYLLFRRVQMEEMAVTQYRQFLSESKVVSSSQSKDAEMVKRVGARIASAVTNFYKGQELPLRYRIINGNTTSYKVRRLMHGACPEVK